MTIEKTRQILGSKISRLKDDEVLELISRTDKTLDVLFALERGRQKRISLKRTRCKNNENLTIMRKL